MADSRKAVSWVLAERPACSTDARCAGDEQKKKPGLYHYIYEAMSNDCEYKRKRQIKYFKKSLKDVVGCIIVS